MPPLTEVLTHICPVYTITPRLGVGGRGGGGSVLGQDHDSPGGGFDASQSLQGEETEVNLWDHVLSFAKIQDLSRDCSRRRGNVINWETVGYQREGGAIVQENNYCDFHL
eukprot:gi/632987345/ref/XP_007910740.1/ PREDICTED: C-reactive protein 1.4-like [Callorhinchus milii]